MNYGTTLPQTTAESSSSSRPVERDISPSSINFMEEICKFRVWLGDAFESRRAHWIIIGLVAADFIAVMSVIIVSFLWPEFEEKEHEIFETLELIAFTINTIFVFEVVIKLFIFGVYYFIKSPHWQLHLFDAVIIYTTFFLEIFLSGKQREVVGLLILFRLWRLIKALSIVAVGLIEYDEDKVDQLKLQNKLLRDELENLLAEIDSIAREDHWNEQKRSRIFSSHQKDLLNEDDEDKVSINVRQ
ncbi:10902_t:CDS:1 [Funneliformis geosporum]|uniref:474_t:CDS:1 n=1 Tax=Funneliformis geosporum TaxID=1117311 RepID=A0A9W4WIM1_9GLOM|nr:10902_t:CDS:1 [Funneliformis geosporum]CAI2164460.1 474_t:CDS:1 [Funneliformis geosporum]